MEMVEKIIRYSRELYEIAGEVERKQARELFGKLDLNGDGKISLIEFKKGVEPADLADEKVFNALDLNRDGWLDFDGVLVLFYYKKDKITILLCNGCRVLIFGPRFSCIRCISGFPTRRYTICRACHSGGELRHEHPLLFTSTFTRSDMLEEKTRILKLSQLMPKDPKYLTKEDMGELREIVKFQHARGGKDMKELWKIAKVHHHPQAASPGVKKLVNNLFNGIDEDDGINHQKWQIPAVGEFLNNQIPPVGEILNNLKQKIPENIKGNAWFGAGNEGNGVGPQKQKQKILENNKRNARFDADNIDNLQKWQIPVVGNFLNNLKHKENARFGADNEHNRVHLQKQKHKIHEDIKGNARFGAGNGGNGINMQKQKQEILKINKDNAKFGVGNGDNGINLQKWQIPAAGNFLNNLKQKIPEDIKGNAWFGANNKGNGINLQKQKQKIHEDIKGNALFGAGNRGNGINLQKQKQKIPEDIKGNPYRGNGINVQKQKQKFPENNKPNARFDADNINNLQKWQIPAVTEFFNNLTKSSVLTQSTGFSSSTVSASTTSSNLSTQYGSHSSNPYASLSSQGQKSQSFSTTSLSQGPKSQSSRTTSSHAPNSKASSSSVYRPPKSG